MSFTDQTTPTRDEVLEEVRAALATAAPDTDAATAAPGADLREELEVDSLALLELVARLEHRYAMQVADEDWPGLTSLDAITDHVLAHLSR